MKKSDSGSNAASYRLKFIPEALVEWKRLDGSIKELLRKLLLKRLQQPPCTGFRITGDLRHCYKIKLRKQGYRLVYSVEDDALVVLVLAVDMREDLSAYRAAISRLLIRPDEGI